MQRQNATRRRKQPKQQTSLAAIPRVFGEGDIVTKRMTLPGPFLSSNGANVIPVTTFTAAQVQSAPASEWASFAARYQQFRVEFVRLILEPVFVSSAAPNNADLGHGSLYVADYIGTAAPGSPAQVLSDEGAIVTSTARRLDARTTWRRNPNAKLWNPTGAALPVANSFGIAVATSPALALEATTTYYTVTQEWLVQFRGSQ